MPRRVDPSLIVTGAGSAVPGSIDPSSLLPGSVTSSGALDAHLSTSGGAHPATAISITDLFERYLSGDVEGALGELAALVPPAPGVVGSAGPPWLGSTNSGIPDWGILKLRDGGITSISTINTPDEIYPYYWRAPVSIDSDGLDPQTDPVYNVVDGPNVYTGGGDGLARAGFVTVSMDGNPADAYPTWRMLPVVPLSIGGDVATVVSGIVSPADRGVLALVSWTASDLATPPVPADTIAKVLARCPAAILLGLGIGSGGAGCDGDPGGIFTVGSPTPFDFPGQAAGQYDLDELQSGVSRTTGPSPVANTAAGQVRLLTDPAAVTFSPSTNANGLPILGATTNARGGVGTDGNFFAYRLPYLKDYSTATGVIYTPRTPDDETTRYFDTLPPASAVSTTQAGNYDDFTDNYWAVQIGRYRHRFVLAVGAAVGLRLDRSYALVHFRREEDFESYVRDGVAPTAAQVYSVNLVNWSGVAQIANLVEAPTAAVVSDAYSVHVSTVVEDANGTAVPAMPGPTNTFTFSGTNATQVSGVLYYKPLNPVGGGETSGITMLDLSITNVFNSGYRTHDEIPTAGPFFGDDRGYALNQCPVFLSLAGFSYEGTETPEAGTITVNPLAEPLLFRASLGKVKRQRIELGFADLLAGAVTNPAVGDAATVSVALGAVGDRISFSGDENAPSFTENAKVRVFVRRPQNTDVTTGYPLPALPAIGIDAVPTNAGTPKILYHSMADHTGVIFPVYGNPTAPANAVLNNLKDREERFLDEIYRYPVSWAPLASAATLAQIIGPGLPGGFAPISVPVRPVDGDPDYEGYYFLGYSTEDLATSGVSGIQNELQIAGLPDRNPPYTDGLRNPAPSRGVLIYPKTDYSTGYIPVGPDYSGAVNDRSFNRVFDAGAANVGASSVTLKFWGLSLSDFAYVGPGPGGVGIAILAKLPGETTWLDVGRADGAGPSKQDLALDGAGCLVSGPNTFDVIDPETRIQCAQVEVNFGPMASLFLNAEGKCPVLVQVVIRNNATGRLLDWQNVASTAATSGCRGLVGIDLIQP